MAGLSTLSWWRNGDSYDVAMVASRLAARDVPVWWCTRASDGVQVPSVSSSLLEDVNFGTTENAGG